MVNRMGFDLYLRETSLTSRKSGYSWSGVVYRATDSKNKQSILGKGLYVTPSERAVKNYGKKIEVYRVRLKKVLGYNSDEWDRFRMKAVATSSFDSLTELIIGFAKDGGYDAVYGGEVLGLCLFKPKKQVLTKLKEMG